MASTGEVARLIESAAAAHPDKTAVVEGEREFSYGSLRQTAARLAALFRARSLAGERVALMLPNGLDIHYCYLACFQSGAIATPVNYRYAPPELEHALTLTEPNLLIIHRDRLDVLAKVDPAVVATCQVFVAGEGDEPLAPGQASFASLLSEEPPPAELEELSPDAPAVMFFTSGSTGLPKGVVHTQASARAMLESTAAAFDGVSENDIIQVAEPMVHVSGYIASLSVLMRGGTVVLLDSYEEARYVETLRRWKPTLICTHIDVLAKLIHWPDIGAEDFTSFRGLYTGGDRIPEGIQKQYVAKAGMPIQLGYGLTEAIWLTICREPIFKADECIGTLIDGVALRVIAPDGSELPDGEVGELCVRGPMVMHGYWRNPEETAKTLADGWLRTGDSGWRDASGSYWFSARIKELIVRNTSKIAPGEVEAALNAHDSVSMSGVVGVPDAEEGEVPVAFVELEPGHTIDEPTLLAFLRTRIAEYKIPVRIQFVETLPLTKSGKLDHGALRALAQGPVKPAGS